MIKLTSKMTMDSALLPGARVHLKKFNVKQRAAVTLQLAAYHARMSDLYSQMLETVIVRDDTDETGAVTKPGDSAEVREQKIIRSADISMQIRAIEDAYLKPALLREYVVSIEGVELDDEPLTPETLLSGALPAFADEIYKYMGENNGLPPFDKSSSPSPSPLPTVEDGNPPSTTATAA